MEINENQGNPSAAQPDSLQPRSQLARSQEANLESSKGMTQILEDPCTSMKMNITP